MEREIETARAMPGGAEFRLAAPAVQPGLFGGGGAALVGFGCATANELVVQRRGENEIVFPGCAEFPYPLVRCR